MPLLCGRALRNTTSFFVFATQNPIEQEGTYPLPEAQLDRFMFNIQLTYPSFKDEVEVVKNTTSDEVRSTSKVLTGEEISFTNTWSEEFPSQIM
jgi:MoxR-like ATPase